MEVNMDSEKIFKLAPSGIDYALKCRRCLWLSYKGIKLDAFFPPIFDHILFIISVSFFISIATKAFFIFCLVTSFDLNRGPMNLPSKLPV